MNNFFKKFRLRHYFGGQVKNVNDFKVELKSKEHIGPEDIFSDTSSPLSGDEHERRLEISVKESLRFNLFFVLVFALLAVIASYLLYFTLLNADEYKRFAQRNSQVIYEIGPDRGDIVSSDGVLLATSVSVFEVNISPHQLSEDKISDISRDLSSVDNNLSFDFLYSRILSARDRRLRVLTLVKNLEKEEVANYQDVVQKHEELHFAERYLRQYPHDNTFSHILGYTASITEEELKSVKNYTLSDTIGKKGIERYFEQSLRGTRGLLAKFLSATGDVIKEALIRERKQGASLELTVDANLQEISYNALQNSLREHRLRGGAVVILDARTGAILALVSLPDFNPNQFAKGLSESQSNFYFNNAGKPLFNRVTSGEYAVGSVIKPILAAAALEENIINPSKKLLTHGYIEVPSVYDSRIIYRFNDWMNHGAVDMIDSIAVSSNVYFYTIGGGYQNQNGLGIDKIGYYLDLFNWGKKLNLDFVAENSGFVPSSEWKQSVKNEPWSVGDTYNVSIGQGDVLATPLQVATSMGVFASEGKLFRPYIVQKSYSQHGDMQEYGHDIINENFISPTSLQVARQGMREAVIRGSSRFLNQLPVAVAGKTGTAQTSRANNAWFSGFAPYTNAEIVITVLLEEGETSDRAVRVAYDILSAYFEQKEDLIQD